jgi:hypothetical protein
MALIVRSCVWLRELTTPLVPLAALHNDTKSR